MANLDIGTAHNTLANEEEEEKTSTVASSNPSARARDKQLANLSVNFIKKAPVVTGETPMNTAG